MESSLWLMPDDPDSASRVRNLSAAVFGSKWRLEILAAIAEDAGGDVYARELAKRMLRASDDAPADNQIRSVLTALAEVGLLRRLEGTGVPAPVYYQRLESPLWALATSLRDAARQKQVVSG